MKQGNFENEEFIRVGTTLYKLVNQPRLNGGYVKKRIVWNNETLRQDYGKDYLATVPKYDGFCTVPRPCGLPSRGGQVPEPLRADRTPSATRRVSLYPVIGAPYLR